MPSYNLGFNFRSTQEYVTDPVNTVGFFGTAYPTSKTIGSTTLNAGWDGVIAVANRSTSIDPRLAGGNTVAQAGSARYFRVDLPVSGTWTIRLAMGNPSFTRAGFFDIIDSDGVTLLYSKTESPISAPQYMDASGVIRNSAATWVTSNASINVTFSGSIAFIRLNPSASYGNEICHISFAKNTAPQATISDVTVETTSGVATITVSLDTVAPIGGCSLEYSTQDGTAIQGVDYTATSGTLTFAPGETSKNVIVPILP